MDMHGWCFSRSNAVMRRFYADCRNSQLTSRLTKLSLTFNFAQTNKIVGSCTDRTVVANIHNTYVYVF